MPGPPIQPPAQRLNQLLTESGSPALDSETAEKFTTYLALLQRWNTRTNLTSIRDEEGILSRHFVESILCARNLPENIVSLLDFGSGAGFPGIPIALLRKDLDITLTESQNKKAAFLREAARTLALNIKIHSGRAEDLKLKFDCVTLRAVDNMPQAIPTAIQLLNPTSYLAIMTTNQSASTIRALAQSPLQWLPPRPLPAGTDRILLLGQTTR